VREWYKTYHKCKAKTPITDDTKGISITISEKWVRKSVTQAYI